MSVLYEASAPPRPRGSLASALRARLEGDVRDDAQARAVYALDASNFRQVPRLVVLPRSEADVVATVALCRAFGVPITCRGGGTALAGQTVGSGVVIDFSRHMDAVLHVDPERKLARVQPGVILDVLRARTREHGLWFGPDPATHSRCTLGGMIGNNSCGVHSILAGRTVDNVRRLKVVTSEGDVFWVGTADEATDPALVRRIAPLRALRDELGDAIRARYPRIPRRVSGYNLDELLPEQGFHLARSLVGSEGTCVVVVEAELELVPYPSKRALVVVGYPSVYEAADHVVAIREAGPIGLEGIDATLVRLLHQEGGHEDAVASLPEGDGWLFVEVGGETDDEVRAGTERVCEAVRRSDPDVHLAVLTDEADQERLWKVREAGLAVTATTDGQEAFPGWEDSAVPPERLSEYLRALRDLFGKYGYEAALYGHFGDGCVHCRITFDLHTADGIARFEAFQREAAELVVSLGGSLSGEHGDGQQRAQLLPLMFGDDVVEGFHRFKEIWDPVGLLNPGKVVDPPPVTRHLKFGPGHEGRDPGATAFHWSRDSFRWAVGRCVGVGACRRVEGGIMCPSYKATRAEEHSTRGRAHLLDEMMRGDPVSQGWRDPAVEGALDLCLSCKGCKTECPMGVDMAKMKAEFLHHRYQGRLRPRDAYTLGLIPVWARLARLAPEAVNAAMAAPGLGSALKWAAGMSPRRQAPRFAPRTFRSWWRSRPVRAGGEPVVLWVDTWTEHFRPEVGIAAVEVLERTGHRVVPVDRPVCCGRPLYEHGMLGTAKRWMGQSCDAVLGMDVPADANVVFLEPSCHATFRDELPDLFPGDRDKLALRSRIRTLGEQLADRDLPMDLHGRDIVLHGHCHQRAGTGIEAEGHVLARLGADVHPLDDGCCGMAGTFGYAPHRVDLSIAIGRDQGFLPAMERAARHTALVVDGFSCGTQLTDQTARRPLHLAQALLLGPGRPGTAEDQVPSAPGASWRRIALTAAAAVAGVGIVVGAWRRWRTA
ncbi:MAG: FAD-linked oxidase C-terminal domain-containing protein [Myxococcota bacterium]